MGTLAQQIVEAVQNQPGITDRWLAEALFGPGTPQQRVNGECRRMAALGLLDRTLRSDGLIGNYCTGKETAPLPISPAENGIRGALEMDVTTDWYWEGNVVDAVEHYLSGDGWEIVNKANTHSKERGVDLYATKSGTTLLVEAKGYPSKQYRDPS